MYEKPIKRPYNPSFSSGPCPKFKGWNLADLDSAVLGRSHRSKLGKNKLLKAIEMTKDVLKQSFSDLKILIQENGLRMKS